MHKGFIAFVFFWVLLPGSATAEEPGFSVLFFEDDLPLKAEPRAVSSDGKYVVGWASGEQGKRAFIWNEEEGLKFIPQPGVELFKDSDTIDLSRFKHVLGRCEARAVSVNGIVTGFCDNAGVGAGRIGFRWSEEEGFEKLSEPDTEALKNSHEFYVPRGQSTPSAISDDGSLIIGSLGGERDPRPLAFRWTREEGTRFWLNAPDSSLGVLPTDMSGDGKTVAVSVLNYKIGKKQGYLHVENQRNGTEPTGIGVWTADGGLRILEENLRGRHSGHYAAVSDDGKVVFVSSLVHETEGVRRYGPGGKAETLQGFHRADIERINGASADGKVAVGKAGEHALIWTKEHGSHKLQNLLQNYYGIAVQVEGLGEGNVQLKNAVAVSADGRTIVGIGGEKRWSPPFVWKVVLPEIPSFKAPRSLSGLIEKGYIREAGKADIEEWQKNFRKKVVAPMLGKGWEDYKEDGRRLYQGKRPAYVVLRDDFSFPRDEDGSWLDVDYFLKDSGLPFGDHGKGIVYGLDDVICVKENAPECSNRRFVYSKNHPKRKQVKEGCALPELPGDFEQYLVMSYEGARELKGIQIDDSDHTVRWTDIIVDRPEKPVVLVLSAYDPVVWRVQRTKETKVAAVIVAGHHGQLVDGIPPEVPTIISTGSSREGIVPSECTELGYAHRMDKKVLKLAFLVEQITGKFFDASLSKYRYEDPVVIGSDRQIKKDELLYDISPHVKKLGIEYPEEPYYSESLDALLEQGFIEPMSVEDLPLYVRSKVLCLEPLYRVVNAGFAFPKADGGFFGTFYVPEGTETPDRRRKDFAQYRLIIIEEDEWKCSGAGCGTSTFIYGKP
jgi:hypothetical protein